MKNDLNRQSGFVSFGWIVAIVLVLGFLGWGMYHFSKVDTLEKELEETKMQLDEVRTDEVDVEKMEEKAEIMGEPIAGVDDPVLRLELFRAYADKIRTDLSEEVQGDLDAVVEYVEANMTVLMTAEPELPDDVVSAMESIRSELTEVEVDEVATAKIEESDQGELVVGDEVTVTGELKYAADDLIDGAGVFTLTTEAGYELYFVFNYLNSETYKNELKGQMVTVTVEITGLDNNIVTYDVVSGPELAEEEAEADAGEVEGESDQVDDSDDGEEGTEE